MAPTTAEAQETLNSLIDTTTELLQQLQTVLVAVQKGTHVPPTDSQATSSLDALALARDSASLMHAHTTKISLLVINEPYTPIAITTVVRELTKGAIPGLASSVEACDTSLYTAVMRRELAWRVQRVFSELTVLLGKIPRDGKVLKGDKKNGFGGGGQGSFAATGKLWTACNDVTALANMGVGGFFVKRAEEWRDMLKDVMEELKEWAEEEPDEDDEDDEDEEDDVDELADQLDDTSLSTQDMMDDLLNSHKTIPKSDPERIRPRLDSSLKRLRLVTLLYQAIVKRRIKKVPQLPPSDSKPDIPNRLDQTAETLKQLPDLFGDLACAFYELDTAEIDKLMAQSFTKALEVAKSLRESWDGTEDEFSSWTDKFQIEIQKN